MRLRITSAILNAVLISLTVSSAVSYDPPTNLLYQRTRMREPPSVNSISTTKASPVNDPNNECSNHVDGLYSYGCKPQYFACSNGAVYHFECPSELVFNDEYSVCDYPAAVKSCAGKYEVSKKDNEVYEEVTQATRAVYEKKNVYERPTTTPTQTTQVPRTGDIDCSRLADGTYSSGCSSEFTVCSNGFTYNQLCPDGLVFNPTGGFCDYPDNCGETTSYKTTAAYETTTTTTTSAPSSGSSHCADLTDGVHSFGCQEEYIVCQSGRTLTGRCPRGLVFNGNTKRCDYLEDCASSTSSYESTTASPPPQVPYATTSAPLTQECVRDGVFAEGCSSEFVVCSNGIGRRQKCPDGLVFNVDLGLCDYKYNCGATKPSEPYVTTAEPQTTTTEAPVQPTYTTSRPYIPPVDTSRTSCINGQRFSTVLCSSSFSECRNGGYLLKTCPTGTLFDSKYGLCMYDVSACRPQKNYDTSATNSAVYATPASAPINVPVSVSKGLCQGGTNYPRGACMSTYLYCRDGLSFDQKECPANHRFDPVNLDCRMPFLISSCYKDSEKVDEPVYINNADHEDIDYVRYGHSDNEVFVRHGRRHDDDSSDSSEEQDSKYLKDDFQGHRPFYQDGVISNPFYKSHKFMKKIPYGRHRHHHRRHRHGRRNGFDIFGGDEPQFAVVSNPFYAKRGHYVKNVRLPDAFDKKMGRLTDSIYRFFPDSKRSVSEKKLTAVFKRGDNRRRDSFEEDSWEHDKADKKWASKVQGSVDIPDKEDAEVTETTTALIIETLAEQAKTVTVDEDENEEEAETSTTTVDDENEEQSVEVDEGSGIEDEEVARSKRYAPVPPSAADSSMCGQGSAMQTVAVGHCHHNFILCNENLQAQVAACPVGETFDAVNKVCVELCGMESESTARVQPIDQSQVQSEQVPETFQETVSQQEPEWNGEQRQQDSARYQEVVEEVRQEHMHPIQDDDSYDQSEIIAPRPAQDVLLTSNQEQASSGPCAARPNGVYSMGCSGSFLTCSNGQSYVTNCPNGLVFDAATAVCNVPEQVAECDGRVQADAGVAPVAGPMIPRPHEYRPVDFVDTFYNGPQSPKANFVQEDSNFNSASYNAKDVPVVDLFNDAENIVNGPSQPIVPINIWNTPQDTVGQTMQPTGEPLPIQRAEPSTCTGRQDGGYRLDCAGAFVICSYGTAHIFNCQPGLHFDEGSQACVYSSSACQTAAAPADPYRVQNVANVPSQPIVHSNVWNGAQNTVEAQNAVNGPHVTVPTNVWSAPGNSAEQTVPQTVAVPLPIQRAEPSECVGRQDGGYRLDCAGTFVICSHGSAHIFNCQPGLHFDAASQACVDSLSACQSAAAPADSYRVQITGLQELPIVPSLVSTPVSVPQQQLTHLRDSAQSETYQAGAYRPELVPTTRSDPSSDRVRAQPTFAGQGADNSVNHQSSRPYAPQVTATPQNEVPVSWSSQSVPESDGTIENLRSDTPYNPRFVVEASERPVGADFVPKSPTARDQYVNDGTPATVDNERPGRLIPAVEYKQFDMSASYPSATVKSWPSESVSDQGREMPRSDEPYRPNVVTGPAEDSFGGDTVSKSQVQEQSVSERDEAMESEQPYRPTFVVVPPSEKSSDGDALSNTSADEDYLNTNAGSKHTGLPMESEQTERRPPGDKPFNDVASLEETRYAPEVEVTGTDASVIPHRPVIIPSVASDEGSVPNEGSEVVIAKNAPYAPKIEEDSSSEQVFVPSTVESVDWKNDATQPAFEKHSDMVTESTIPHRPDSQIFEGAERASEVTVPTNDKRQYVSDKDAEVEKFDNKQDKNVDNTNTRVLPIVIVPDVVGGESDMSQGTFKSDDLCSGSDVIIGAACAEEFIACLDGRSLRMTCSQGTVFDVTSKSCMDKEAIQECSVPARDQNDMSESVTETVHQKEEPEGEFIEDLTSEPTDDDEDSVADEATSLPAVIDDATASALTTGLPCDPEAHPLFPVAACSITYAVCHEDGFARAVNCSSTQLFDHILYECVPSEMCGHSHFKELLAAIEMGEGLTSAREACIGAKSGHKRFLGECRRSYAVCGRRPTIERCPRDHVFSKAKNACVNKKTIGACRAQINKSTMTEFKKTESTNTAVQTPARSFDGEPGTFCSDREDGLYRHPTECSGIVQCLGGRMIDRRSCTSGLVFNEKTKQCDYATDEKCSRASPLAQDATGCDGHEHGAHFEDSHNCSIFYRCVWNRKVQMDCAPGTLFNKDLSVCDWPSAVPDCVDGVRESEGDDNTAEEDHDIGADDDREHDDYDDEQKVDNHDFIEPAVTQDEDKPEVSDEEYKPQISKDEADADVDTEADAYDHA